LDMETRKTIPLSSWGSIFLAPMAGVTDHPFRLLCREKGASLVFTEMVSAKALHYKDDKTFEIAKTYPDETPVGIQIFGHEPEIMAEAAAVLSKQPNVALIDINMGCPAPKIVKNGDGSALMKKPDLVRQIVREVVKASEKPVTVKIRKGWNDSSVNCIEIASICEEEGASMVTVHGRTREQQYSGNADWECIRSVKKALTIPVTGNGDVRSPEDALRMLEETGCDAVMIGRGALGNPWLFEQIQSFLRTGTYQKTIPNEERLQMIMRHYQLMVGDKGERLAMLEMRKHVAWYLHGLPNSAKVKAEIFNSCSTSQVKEIIREYFSSL